jgi:hypothetical protein
VEEMRKHKRKVLIAAMTYGEVEVKNHGFLRKKNSSCSVAEGEIMAA